MGGYVGVERDGGGGAARACWHTLLQRGDVATELLAVQGTKIMSAPVGPERDSELPGRGA